MNEFACTLMEERILILAPTVKDAQTTQRIFNEICMETYICKDVAELCREMEKDAGAMLVTQEAILSNDCVLKLNESLRKQPPWSDFPLIVLTPAGTESRQSLKALESVGHMTLMKRPVQVSTIISTVEAVLRDRRRQYKIRDLLMNYQSAKEKAESSLINLAILSEKTHQQKRIYETALSNTADFNYVFDLEGRFIYINKPLLDLWEKTFEEAVGKDFLELDYPPELAQRLHEQIQQVIRTKELVRDETPYTSPSGTRAYEYIFKPVIGENGMVEAVAGSTRDITEYREANRRKDEFLAMLAHELRNPLAPISNAMHIMKSGSISEKIREEASLLVDRQVTQMTHLLNDLLDVSRVTLGKIELRPSKVALSEIINMAVESIKPLIETRGQTLHVDIPDDYIWLYADQTRLSQVFSNLLNNAAKYTDKGGHIEVAAAEDRLGVTVKISDNGIGIPQEIQPTIFDLFSQVDSSMERAQGGLGIGLTLVKNLVEMHKGTVTVTSEGKGRGSTFTVRLPIQIQIKEKEEEIMPEHNSTTTQHYRVLIVDDNEASAKTLGWTLEMLGHESRLAHEGKKAIEVAKDYVPDIILLDIGLPGMNGYEVCRAIRQEPKLRDAVIIAQTGWGQKEHLKLSQEAGFNYHLVKPIRIETLEGILAKVPVAA